MLKSRIFSLTADLIFQFFVGEAWGERRIIFWKFKENQNFVFLLCLHVCELLYIVSFVVKSPSGGKNPWKQHLRIQEGHFLKSALNLDLTRSNARSRREDFDCIFFIHVGAFCVELRPFYCKKRISVPMSYISWLGIDVYPNVSRYTRTCPGTPRRERDRPCLILLTITNGTTPYFIFTNIFEWFLMVFC